MHPLAPYLKERLILLRGGRHIFINGLVLKFDGLIYQV